MNEILEMARIFAEARLAPTIHFHNVHDNRIDKYFAAAEPDNQRVQGRARRCDGDEEAAHPLHRQRMPVGEGVRPACRKMNVPTPAWRLLNQYIRRGLCLTEDKEHFTLSEAFMTRHGIKSD